MWIFVLRYEIQHEAYMAVVKASDLERAKEIVNEFLFPCDNTFIRVLQQMQDKNEEMAITTGTLPWR